MVSSGQKVCVVDYEAGNLTSVCLALEELGWETIVTGNPDTVVEADRLIFPGVGAAPAAMSKLKERGLGEAITEYALSGRPLLGICLGAQIIFDRSAEGDAECLGLLDGSVEPLTPSSSFKVPHMGWNAVEFAREHPVWNGIEAGAQFYFVHGYVVIPDSAGVVIGRTEYDELFVSAVAKHNIVAFQFHPERSGKFGLEVLRNFLRWSP